MKKLISNSAIGIGTGFSILVLFMTIAVLIAPDFLGTLSQQEFIKYVICAAITGLGFSIPSMIYECNSLSRVLQTAIHLGTGFIIYIPAAFIAGWIPTQAGLIAISVSISMMIIFVVAIWFCFWLYFRKQAEVMNKKIAEKQKE